MKNMSIQLGAAENQPRIGRTEDWNILLSSPTVVTGLAVFAGYYLGAKLGFALTFRPYPVSVLWPPNAILAAALLLTPLRIWWLVLLAAFLAHWAAELQSQIPPGMILCWFISNSFEAVIGAGLTRYLIGGPIRLNRLRNVGFLCLCVVFAGPFLSSFLDAGFVRWNGWGQDTYWKIWRVRFTSNVLAALTVAPLIVTWATSGIPSLPKAKRSRYVEAALLVLGLLAVSFVVLYKLGSRADLALLYLLLPFLLWAAVQFGSCGASTALGIVTFSAIWAATHGHGPFSGGSPAQNALAVQVFLIVLAVPLIFLAAVVEEHANVRQRFAKVFRSSPDAMFVVRRRDFCIIDVNEHWQAIFGYPRDEAVNHTISDLNLNIREGYLEKLVATTSGGEPLRDVEMSFRTKTGDLRQTVLSADTLDLGGEPCFVVIIRDITNRKRREAALLESQAELRETQRRMDLAATAADLGIWVWDIVRDEIWVSEKERALFGFAPSEKPDIDRFRNAIHPDDRASMRKALKNSLNTGMEYEAEHRVLLPNGQIRWLATRGRVEFGGDGKPARMRGVSFDVTRRKLGEEALSESEARFRTMADTAPVMIWVAGVDKLCTFFNKPWLEFTGRKMEQEMGNGWAEGVHPDDLQRCLKIHTEAFDARQPFIMQYRLRRHDGEYRWISDNGVPRYDAQGNFTGYIGSCVDVTELINKERALRESEERMSLAAEAANLAVWEWDLSKDEVWTTGTHRELPGRPVSEKGTMENFVSRLHIDDRDRVRQALKDAIDSGKEFASEFRFTLPDGRLRWATARGRCIKTPDGKNMRFRGVSMDVTAQKDVDDLFRLATESSLSGVALVNERGEIILVNSQIEKLFGYRREELVGKPVEVLVPERFAIQHPVHREKFIAAPTTRAMGAGRELFARRKDGSEFPVEIGLNPIQTPDGIVVLTTVVDITARKMAEAEALRHREEIGHLSRVAAMGELAASIAHELNQPLSGIVSNAAAGQRFIDRGDVDLKEIRELLADISADGRRAGDVIRGIQSMVKKRAPVRQRVNLNDLVLNVVQMVKPNAMLHSCEVGTFLDPDLPTVEADPVQLQQVLLNLIINAFDAMRDTPLGRQKIAIATERNGDATIRTSVRDYGVGIPEEAHERVFEQFFTTKAKGLGLGLAIVRSIVESHGGAITVENAEDGGARFQFTLPASVTPSAV
jgi:PAS domain S-box-containing protein